MASGADTSDLTRYANQLDAVAAGTGAILRPLVKHTADEVADGQRAAVRVGRTGRLRDSIGADLDDDGLGATVGSDSPFAHLEEWGSVHQAPHPFIEPPLDGPLDAFIDAAAEASARALTT